MLCDVFDPEALSAAVGAAHPDVVVHKLTSLPAKLEPREKGVYDANNRIRTEGTRNLVAAARAAGAPRMVAQSIAFVYAPVGGPVKSEDDPVIEGARGEFGDPVDGDARARAPGAGRRGLEGLVLRYGVLLRPGTSYAADGHQASEVRRRRFPIVGAATASSRSSTSTTPPRPRSPPASAARPGIYNVCDDEPAPLREWLPVYAEAVGAKRAAAGPEAGRAAGRRRAGGGSRPRLRGASNEKAKRELGWEPTHPSWRRASSRRSADKF